MIIFIDKGGSNYLLFYYIVLSGETNYIMFSNSFQDCYVSDFRTSIIELKISGRTILLYINCSGGYSK